MPSWLRNIIEAWKAAKQAERKARREAEIALRFRVCERGGRLFILCGGTAFCVVPEPRTADYIVADLEAARRAALDFDSMVDGANATNNTGTGNTAE